MRIRRCLPLLVCFLSCLLAATARADDQSPPTAEPDVSKQDPLVRTWLTGARLLGAQRWDEAADLLCLWPHALERSVETALTAQEAEDAAFRLAVIEFYFRHLNFSSDGWHRHIDRVREYGRNYVELLAKAPEPDRETRLDFSQLELLDEFGSQQPGLAHRLAAREADIVAALERHPDSIPAIAALLALMEVAQSPSSDDDHQEERRAQAAHRLLTGDFGRLTLARAVASRPTGVRLTKAEKMSILEAGCELAPHDEQRAQLLYELVELQTPEAIGQPDEEAAAAALANARRVWERFPRSKHAAKARGLAVRLLLQDNRLDEALALVRQLQAAGEVHRAGLDDALFNVSQAHFQRQQFDASEALLLEIVRDYGQSTRASRAMLGLAEICVVRGDAEQQRVWLERCAGLDRTEPTGRSLMDTDNTRSEGIQRLAVWHEQRGNWTEALAWWEKWRPESWCGTCLASMNRERFSHVGRCLEGVGRHGDAARLYLAMFTDNAPTSFALAAECLYRDAGQTKDLHAIAREIDRRVWREFQTHEYLRTKPRERLLRALPGWPIRESLRIRKLGREADVAALIAIVREADSEGSFRPPDAPWRARIASDALADCDAAVPQILDSCSPAELTSSHLMLALGRHRAPAAFDALKRLALQEEESHASEGLAHALLLQGEAGRELLEELAGREGHPMQNPARRWLEQAVPTTVAPPAPRPPRRGSLPTLASLEIDEVGRTTFPPYVVRPQ